MFNTHTTAFALLLSLVANVSVCSEVQSFTYDTVTKTPPSAYAIPSHHIFCTSFTESDDHKSHFTIERQERFFDNKIGEEAMRWTTSTIACSPIQRRELEASLKQNGPTYIRGSNKYYAFGQWFEIAPSQK